MTLFTTIQIRDWWDRRRRNNEKEKNLTALFTRISTYNTFKFNMLWKFAYIFFLLSLSSNWWTLKNYYTRFFVSVFPPCAALTIRTSHITNESATMSFANVVNAFSDLIQLSDDPPNIFISFEISHILWACVSRTPSTLSPIAECDGLKFNIEDNILLESSSWARCEYSICLSHRCLHKFKLLIFRFHKSSKEEIARRWH